MTDTAHSAAAAPLVSIVIPAHDADGTLGETLDALLAQTFSAWEAIVVDDGSRDGTVRVAQSYVARDSRVRLLQQPQRGVGAARNAGVAAAHGAWFLFVDADDWISPNALERFLAASTEGADAVVAGWARMLSDGRYWRDPFRPDPSTLFATLARFCPFAIHACLVSRHALERAGTETFAPDLLVGEDWDFWQRVARAGARFVVIDSVLALYRVRPGSSVNNASALLAAGHRIIRRGHGADPRVIDPDPRFANGMPADGLNEALFAFLSWPAGMLLGSSGDPRDVLAMAPQAGDYRLEPEQVAHSLFLAALLPDSRPVGWWSDTWPRLEERVDAYLAALEAATGSPALARRTRQVLESLVPSPPVIALVVCTRNRAAHLPAALSSLAALRPSVPWELILVDNGSSDGTGALLRDFAARAEFDVAVVAEPRPGLACARNAGVRAARAPLLAFTDDDCYPDPDLLDRWVECFADPAVGYGAGRILLHDPEDFPITIRTDPDPQFLPPGAFVEPGFLQGANMAFRRDLLHELGGFDPALGPGGRFNFEDLDMSSRASSAGAAGGYFPGPTVRHHHRRRHPGEIADLRHSYARGRGAYFASLLLRGDGSRALVGHLRRSLSWKPRTEVALEVVSALYYAAYRLVRPAERPLRG